MNEPYEGWAIVEIMGHQTFAGLVKTETQYGVEMLRVDVPEVAAETRREFRFRYGPGQREIDVEYPGIPAYTKFFGGGSIYGITPCTEEVARRAVATMRKAPVSAVYMPELEAQPRVITPMIEAGDEEDDESEGQRDRLEEPTLFGDTWE